MASASCLRALFVALLVFNAVANPLALWQRFKEDMAEDFLYQARQVLSSARVWLCMSACLAALHGHGLHVVRRSMLTMLCVCSYNVQGEPAQQLNAAIRTWCCRSWRCNWHTSTAARAWQHLACRRLRPNLRMLWWQTKLPGMTRQRKQPCEMSTCHNLTLSNGLSMTMSWPLSTTVHFLSMALAALAKPFSTVAC